MKKFFFYGAFSLLCITTNAQTITPSDSLSLSEAWQLAVRKNPSVQAFSLAMEAASQNIALQKNGRLPDATFQAQQTYGSFNSSYGTFFPLNGTMQVAAPGNVDHSSDGVSNVLTSTVASWRLYQFGYIRQQIEAAKSYAKIANNNAALNELNIKLNVTQAWLSVAFNRHLIRWAEQNVFRLDSLAAITGALSAAGVKPAADSLLAYAYVKQAKGLLAQYQGELSSSYALLNAAIGFTSDSIFNYNVSSGNFVSDGFTANNIALNTTHPELEQKISQRDYDSSLAQSYAKSVYPSLSLLGGAYSRSSGIGRDGSVDPKLSGAYKNAYGNYLVGIGVQWQLSNLYNGKKQKSIQLLKASSDQWDYEAIKVKMQGQLQSLIDRNKALFTQLSLDKAGVSDATKAFELYQVRFQTGIVNLTEVLQTQAILQQAERLYLNDLYSFWTQLASMAYLTNDFDVLSMNF